MKKIILLCWIAICWFSISTLAQTTDWKAIKYQAVARNEEGLPMKNRTVWLKVSLTNQNNSAQAFYIEKHKVSTSETGAFQLNIGRGNPLAGSWTEIPWAKESIWLSIEMTENEQQPFNLVSEKQLFAVPFAFHAATADRLVQSASIDLEKGSSIYWNTSGNSGTQPPTHFLGTTDNKNLTFKSNNIAHMTLTTQGKLELISKVTAGSDKKKEFYPMVVEGTVNTQGMWIKINGSRSNANNFMTFVDDAGIQGRIEGQTITELEASEIYTTQTALFELNTIVLAAEIAALFVEGPAKVASGWSTLAGIAVMAKIANLTVKAASLVTAFSTWVDRVRKAVGITYSSGNGDYAEWLMRKPGVRDLQFGEVVGVKNGQISLLTKDADHLMVVSKAPLVLGNAPQPDQEDLFEKVAFMGQVPVRVVGAVELNDYILPSGNSDGLAIAVHPKDMKTLDFGRIIGVAWEAAESHPINFVNVAVGINTNDLAAKVEELSAKVGKIEAFLAKKTDSKADFSNLDLTSNLPKVGSTSYEKSLSDAEFDQYLDQHTMEINTIYQQVRSQLEAQNYNFQSNPLLLELMNNPVEVTKKLRRNPAYATQWGMVDQKIQLKK